MRHIDAMKENERKRHERDIYNRRTGTDRPEYGSFWDGDLFQRMHDLEQEPVLDGWGKRFLIGRKVLVLGAGPKEVRFALRYTDDVHALNIAQRAVEQLEKTFPKVRCFVADAEHLERNEQYDAVLCHSILHHLHPIESILDSVHEVLLPNGHLFIYAEPGLLNPFAAVARRLTPSRQHTPGERPFVFSNLRRLIEQRYSVEVEHHYFILAMLLPFLAKKLPATKPLAELLLAPTLQIEALARLLPGVRNLCWIGSGVYRARK